MEYLKELYSCNIDEDNIWCKCPFTKLTHQFLNESKSLLNRDEELFIEEKVEQKEGCACGKSVIVNIGNFTNRISLQLNKKKTNYIVKKKTRNKLKLLHQLELEGRRTFTSEADTSETIVREVGENDNSKKKMSTKIFT